MGGSGRRWDSKDGVEPRWIKRLFGVSVGCSDFSERTERRQIERMNEIEDSKSGKLDKNEHRFEWSTASESTDEHQKTSTKVHE